MLVKVCCGPIRATMFSNVPNTAVVFHVALTKFFRSFRWKAEEFFGLIHYCRKELQ